MKIVVCRIKLIIILVSVFLSIDVHSSPLEDFALQVIKDVQLSGNRGALLNYYNWDILYKEYLEKDFDKELYNSSEDFKKKNLEFYTNGAMQKKTLWNSKDLNINFIDKKTIEQIEEKNEELEKEKFDLIKKENKLLFTVLEIYIDKIEEQNNEATVHLKQILNNKIYMGQLNFIRTNYKWFINHKKQNLIGNIPKEARPKVVLQ